MDGYNGAMEVSVAEAKNHLPRLLRAAEAGQPVVITRHGKPVARLEAMPPAQRRVQLGWMRGQVRYQRGWDAPMSEREFLTGKPGKR